MLARRWPEAAAEYKSFIERYDDQHDSSELRAVVRDAKTSLSSVCVYMQDNEEAERWLEEVLDEFPDDVGAHNDLGYLWADRGVHLQRALQMTRFAVEREPDNRAYRDSYGWALFRLGRHAEAVEQLRQAAAGETTDGVILEHLGDALRATDDVAGALDAWRRALDALDEDEADRRAEVQAKIEQLEKDSKP
jgi:Tfp pilus assembly protein PilF